jgi:hypothetical protein
MAVVGLSVASLCQPGYAKGARDVPAPLKRAVFVRYGMEGNRIAYCAGSGGCVIDHLVSLELGGANDIRNLWPEPYDGPWNARDKDRLEDRLHRMVCRRSLPLAVAQTMIARDWIDAYRRWVGDALARAD